MGKNQLKKEELLDEKPPVCFITDEVNIPIAETTAIVVASVVYYMVFRMTRELNPAFILGMVTFIAAAGSGAMLSELDYAGSPFSQSMAMGGFHTCGMVRNTRAISYGLRASISPMVLAVLIWALRFKFDSYWVNCGACLSAGIGLGSFYGFLVRLVTEKLPVKFSDTVCNGICYLIYFFCLVITVYMFYQWGKYVDSCDVVYCLGKPIGG